MYTEGNFQTCKGFIPMTTLILFFTVIVSIYPLIAMHFFKNILSVLSMLFISGKHDQETKENISSSI